MEPLWDYGWRSYLILAAGLLGFIFIIIAFGSVLFV